jgi:hypothetical protein
MAMIVAVTHADVLWGYEDFVDNDSNGKVDEWGVYNIDFVPLTDGDQNLGFGTISNETTWGKVYYGTGASSDDMINQYQYLYMQTYSISGNIRVALSGPADADYYEVSPHALEGDTGDPNVVTLPGHYIFDISGWSPAETHDNVSMQIVAEGGEGESFQVNRIRIQDDYEDTPWAASVPEPNSAVLILCGLAAFAKLARRRRSGA